VDNARWATISINGNLRHRAPQQDLAAGRFHCFGKRVTQALGAAPDVAAARAEESALRGGEQDPP